MPRLDLPLWRARSERFLLGGSATVVLTLAGVIRTKWLASTLSAAGIGVLAQVFSMYAWLGTVCTLGLTAPFTSALAAAEATGDDHLARRILQTALTMAGLATATIVAIGLVFAAPISHALLATEAHAPLVRVAMIAVAGLTLQNIVLAALAARSDLRAPLALAVAGGAASVAATLLLVPRFGLLGGAIGSVVLFPFGLLGVWLLHGRRYRTLLTPWTGAHGALARSLVVTGAAMLLLAVVDQGTLLSLRADFLRRNGIESNGLFQAALALSQQVGALFYSYLWTYAFGKVSAAPTPDSVRDYTRKTWTPLVLLALVVFGTILLASGPLLRLFFSARFDGARPMLAWAMVGEMSRVQMQAWILGALPLRRTGRVVAISLTFPVTLAIAYTTFVSTGAGVMALAWAYAAAGTVCLLVCGGTMSRAGVTLTGRQLAIGAGAVAALAWLATRLG